MSSVLRASVSFGGLSWKTVRVPWGTQTLVGLERDQREKQKYNRMSLSTLHRYIGLLSHPAPGERMFLTALETDRMSLPILHHIEAFQVRPQSY